MTNKYWGDSILECSWCRHILWVFQMGFGVTFQRFLENFCTKRLLKGVVLSDSSTSNKMLWIMTTFKCLSNWKFKSENVCIRTNLDAFSRKCHLNILLSIQFWESSNVKTVINKCRKWLCTISLCFCVKYLT